MSYRLAAVAAALLVSPSPAPPGDALLVPRARLPILLDGKVEDAEWRDARSVRLGSGLRLLVKHDSAYLYLALDPGESKLFGVNLYLASDDTARTYLALHASAKLGERTGRRGAWPGWDWWNNAGWAANVVRFNAFEGQRFLPEVGKEYQISLSRLPAAPFRMSLDLEGPDGASEPVTAGPTADGLHWLTVRLAP